MCGIVGAVANNDIIPVLVEGLKRLEYRGYDSAGVAVLKSGNLERVRRVGKVRELDTALSESGLSATTGIAHTRWATHGQPSEANAHPHTSADTIAVVCNGIIENHDELRADLVSKGYVFMSETDTEVVAHQIHFFVEQGIEFFEAVTKTCALLEGAYALAIIKHDEPNRMIGARRGSPLIVGLAENENFIASDISALLPVTNRYLVLDDGDLCEIDQHNIRVVDDSGKEVSRPIRESKIKADAVELGEYRHYMLKEIYEQATAVADTLDGRLSGDRILEQAFGPESAAIFDATRFVQIIACGTSYHAGLVASYWLESFGVPCRVEIASEFRYRAHAVPDDALVVTISQSGETADTIAALGEAKKIGFKHSLSICNVPESSLVRESDICLMTHAGPEIGVASTKAFTTQLAALMLFAIAMGRRFNMDGDTESRLVSEMKTLPEKIEQALNLDEDIAEVAKQFADKEHSLFLGRGAHYPIAMEGALKLKEISYIHAEAYAAGELKHGPLALVDSRMPVIAVAPNNELLEKLKSNIHEVRARGGRLLVFADAAAGIDAEEDVQVMHVAPVDDSISPIIYTIPLQLLSYHVALIKGTDVDKPRNLAKSVTVE